MDCVPMSVISQIERKSTDVGFVRVDASVYSMVGAGAGSGALDGMCLNLVSVDFHEWQESMWGWLLA